MPRSGRCVDVTKIMQRQESAGGVVRVGHAAGQIGPSPSAGRSVGVGMRRAELLGEQPGAQSLAILESSCAGIALIESVVSQVERFVSIGQLPSSRTDAHQEFDAFRRHGMICQAGRRRGSS